MQSPTVQQNLPVHDGVAEHNGAMSALWCGLEEVRYNLRVFAKIDTTEPRDAVSSMGMDVKQSSTVL